MTTNVYDVPTMHCSSCVMLLEGLEDDVPGITSVEANLKHRTLTVTFDESTIREEDIINAAHTEGYQLITQTTNS